MGAEPTTPHALSLALRVVSPLLPLALGGCGGLGATAPPPPRLRPSSLPCLFCPPSAALASPPPPPSLGIAPRRLTEKKNGPKNPPRKNEKKRKTENGNPPADHSIFVGDLAPEVTDLALQEAFRAFFPSVRSAKVITDPATGRSRGYGFVRFGDGGERDAALARMQGHPLCDRPIRVSPATAKKGGEMMMGGGGQGGQGGGRGFGGFGGGPGGGGGGQFGGFGGGGGPGGYGGGGGMNGGGGNYGGGGGGGHPAPADPNLATIFVGNLADAGDAELRAAFGHLGEVLYTKVPPGKGCGFVQFAARPSAEAAIASMQGALVGSQHVRVSWGRGPCGPPRAPPGALLPGEFWF